MFIVGLLLLADCKIQPASAGWSALLRPRPPRQPLINGLLSVKGLPRLCETPRSCCRCRRGVRLPGGVAVHLESRHHQLAVRAVLHVGSHREPLASAGWRTRPSSGARRRGQRRGGDPPADLSVGDPEDRGLRVKVGRPEGQQVFERRTSRRSRLAPEAWKVTSSHRRSAASERRSGPSRSTVQIATSTRPRLSAAWGVPRGSAFSGFAWRCGRVSALASPAAAPGVGGDVLFAGAAVGVGDPGPGPGRPQVRFGSKTELTPRLRPLHHTARPPSASLRAGP